MVLLLVVEGPDRFCGVVAGNRVMSGFAAKWNNNIRPVFKILRSGSHLRNQLCKLRILKDCLIRVAVPDLG
jgi:hypothetical protein